MDPQSLSKYGWNGALGYGGIRQVLSPKELEPKTQADNETKA